MKNLNDYLKFFKKIFLRGGHYKMHFQKKILKVEGGGQHIGGHYKVFYGISIIIKILIYLIIDFIQFLLEYFIKLNECFNHQK